MITARSKKSRLPVKRQEMGKPKLTVVCLQPGMWSFGAPMSNNAPMLPPV